MADLFKNVKRNLWVGVLVVVVAWAGYFAGREFWHWFGLRQELNAINKDIDKFKTSTENLNRQIESLSDPALLEKEARAKLNLKKEGENVFIVVGEENFPPEDFLNTPAPTFALEGSFWFNLRNWWQYFFP